MNKNNIFSMMNFFEYHHTKQEKTILSDLSLNIQAGEIVGIFSSNTSCIDNLFYNLKNKTQNGDGLVFIEGKILGVDSFNLKKYQNEAYVNFSLKDWSRNPTKTVFSYLSENIDNTRDMQKEIENFTNNLKIDKAFCEILETNIATFQKQSVKKVNDFLAPKVITIKEQFQLLKEKKHISPKSKLTFFLKIFKSFFYLKEITQSILFRKWVSLFDYYFQNKNESTTISSEIKKYIIAKENLKNTIYISKTNMINTEELLVLTTRKALLKNYIYNKFKQNESNALILRKHVLNFSKRISHLKKRLVQIKEKESINYLSIYAEFLLAKKTSRMCNKYIDSLKYLPKLQLFSLLKDWKIYNNSFLLNFIFLNKRVSKKEIIKAIRSEYEFKLEAYLNLSLENKLANKQKINNEHAILSRMDIVKESKQTRLTKVSINKARSDFAWEEKKFIENYDKVVNEQREQNRNNLITMNKLNNEIHVLFKQMVSLFNNFKINLYDDFYLKNSNQFKKIQEYIMAFKLLQKKQNQFINVDFEDFKDLTFVKRESNWKQTIHNLITKATIFKHFNNYKLYKYLLLTKLKDLTEAEFLNVMIIRKFLNSPKFVIVNSTFWNPKMNSIILKIITKYVKKNNAAAIFIVDKVDIILKSTTRAISFNVDSFVEWGETNEIMQKAKHPATQKFFNKSLNNYFEDSKLKLNYKIWQINPNHFIKCSANNYFAWVKKHPIGYIPKVELALMEEIEEKKLKDFQKINVVKEFTIIDISSKILVK